MRQSRLRLYIFCTWVAFWVASTVLVGLAPVCRSDQAVGRDQVVPVVMAVAGIWLPALSALASFWFPEKERARASRSRVPIDRSVGALTITAVYLLFVLFMLLNAVYWINYRELTAGAICPPPGSSLEEQVAAVVKVCLLVSPVALAPINWLTGRPND